MWASQSRSVQTIKLLDSEFYIYKYTYSQTVNVSARKEIQESGGFKSKYFNSSIIPWKICQWSTSFSTSRLSSTWMDQHERAAAAAEQKLNIKPEFSGIQNLQTVIKPYSGPNAVRLMWPVQSVTQNLISQARVSFVGLKTSYIRRLFWHRRN